MRQRLSCDSLGDLGEGSVREVLNDALQRLLDDVLDRQNDKRPRKLTILLKVSPTGNKQSPSFSVLVEPKLVLPTMIPLSTSVDMSVGDNGTPVGVFQSRSAKNPKQNTLDEFEQPE